jgi:hypothetical protein
LDLRRHPPAPGDLVVPVKLDGLQIGCGCGCMTRVVFSRVFDDGAEWVMWAEDAHYPVRWGLFRRRQSVCVELVLDDPATVDALIEALRQIRGTMESPKGRA